jgi:hypothetical protein
VPESSQILDQTIFAGRNMTIFARDCAICGGEITGNTPHTSTGSMFPESHPLWEYCGTGLHQTCLIHWPFRQEFSAAFCSERFGAISLLRHEKWLLLCGPIAYGPEGKVGRPYYAEIRLRNWPIRLYSRFEEWDSFVHERKWEAHLIDPIKVEIMSLIETFPASVDALDDLLLANVARMMKDTSSHEIRYIAVLALRLFGEKSKSFISDIQQATQDEHGSVRTAAYTLLKHWRSSTDIAK